MANPGKIKINVEMNVTKETVDRCLYILSMYLTDNPQVDLEVHQFEKADGIDRSICIVERDEL